MKNPSSKQKSFVTYRLTNGWTDFQVFGVCGFIWLPWVFMAHRGLPQVPGKPPPPRFLFLAKPFWQLTKWTCHTFWRKWLNRFEWGIRWKVWNTQMLSYAIWVTYAETPWGARPQPVLLFWKTVPPSIGRKMKLDSLLSVVSDFARLTLSSDDLFFRPLSSY